MERNAAVVGIAVRFVSVIDKCWWGVKTGGVKEVPVWDLKIEPLVPCPCRQRILGIVLSVLSSF